MDESPSHVRSTRAFDGLEEPVAQNYRTVTPAHVQRALKLLPSDGATG